MSGEWTGFMFDTLLWTAALIALVLAIRRPVARWFGPQIAYGLWLLPLLRLILPPLTLPAWLASTPAAAPTSQSEIIYMIGSTDAAAAVPAVAASPSAEGLIGWGAALFAVWLGGTAIFLATRFRAYFRMRAVLLENAINVGDAGKIRLIESAATVAPIAFGVLDRVIALPEGFMAGTDRAARDLALDHEIAHHRGGDLLINFAIQPLFALHWFNPLAYAGWRAMRLDQEAACDARVVADRPDEVRAQYGEVIAGLAAQNFLRGLPNPLAATFTLATPMACPVLGDKSIIQRLRNLTMTDISPRRRFAGRAAIVIAALALPVTASITYAENIDQGADIPAPPKPPAAPLEPSAFLSVAAPLAPDAPPAPPAANAEHKHEVHVERIVIGPDGQEINDDGSHRVTVIRNSSESGGGGHPDTHQRHRQVRILSGGDDVDMAELEREVRAFEIRIERDGDLSEEAMEAIELKLTRSLKGAEDARMRLVIRCNTNSSAAGGDGGNCTSDYVGEGQRADQGLVMKRALDGLKAARERLSSAQHLSDEMRASVLQTLDQEIATLSAE